MTLDTLKTVCNIMRSNQDKKKYFSLGAAKVNGTGF